MKVVFIFPWFRSLGHLYGDGIVKAGHGVTLITRPDHFEESYSKVPEILISRSKVTNMFKALWAVIRSDIVVVEETSHPASLFLTLFARRRVLSLHDFKPHDAQNTYGGLRAYLRRWQMRREVDHICFSEHVASQVRMDPRRNVWVVPLTSEMPDEWAPSSERLERKHFAMIGRFSEYKNIDLVAQAVREGALSEGEEIHLYGRGDVTQLPESFVRKSERFKFKDIADKVATYKAVLIPYKAASQSGVQLFAYQCGTPAIISNLPGLLEYNATGGPVIDLDDGVNQLRDAMLSLSEHSKIERLGVDSRDHYLSRCSQRAAGQKMAEVLQDIVFGKG